MRYLTLLLIIFLGCGRNSDQAESPAPVSSVDTAMVVAEGQQITKEAFNTLSTNLQKALAEGGVPHALTFCNVEAIPLTDSLAATYGIVLRRASHRPRNPDNRADSLESESIRAYLEKIQEEEELTPRVYRSGGHISYHSPIRIPGTLCLNCHGQPDLDIAASDLAVINKLYPEDEATGFESGDLRGIWSIDFPAEYFETKQSTAPK